MFHTVLFSDGTFCRLQVYACHGACIVGQPTIYTIRYDRIVWVIPGESVNFTETDLVSV